MTYLKRGQYISRILPPTYDPSVKYFFDDFKNADNWSIYGTYEITQDGIRVYGNTRAISINPLVTNKNFFTIIARVRFNEIKRDDKFILLGIADSSGSQTVYFTAEVHDVERFSFYIGFYVNDQFVDGTGVEYYSPEPLEFALVKADDIIQLLVFNGEFFAPIPLWVTFPQGMSAEKIIFGTSGGDITYSYIGVYESSGLSLFGLKYVLDDNQRMFTDGEYFYAISREGYDIYDEHGGLKDYTSRLIVLRTKNLIDFEPYKHITLNIRKVIPLYAHFDGNYIYVWCYNDQETYQDGLHKLFIVVLDTNFNVVDINENVMINNLSEGNVEGVYFIKVHGEWYALGVYEHPPPPTWFKLGYAHSLALFKLTNPSVGQLDFINFITSIHDSTVFLSAYTVTDLCSEYILVILPYYELDIYVSVMFLDTSFNILAELKPFRSPIGEYPICIDALFTNRKILYFSENMVHSEFPHTVYMYEAITDLYNALYTPKEPLLTITATKNNITVKLLAPSDEGRYVPVPNATIHIYELHDVTTWNPIGDYVTDQNGVVSIDRTNTQTLYKAVFDGTAEYRPAITYASLSEQPPPSQPPPEQQPSAQQSLYPCPSYLWLLLLFTASLFRRKREQTEA